MREHAREPVSGEPEGRALCDMLNTLFATNLNDRERFERLTDNFQVTVDNDLKEDVRTMCNLGQGLLEKGEALGEARGEALGEARGEKKKEIEHIISFYMDGDSVERLAKVMKKSETEIRQVLVEHGVSLEH